MVVWGHPKYPLWVSCRVKIGTVLFTTIFGQEGGVFAVVLLCHACKAFQGLCWGQVGQ